MCNKTYPDIFINTMTVILIKFFNVICKILNLCKDERRNYNETSFKETLKRDAHFRKFYKEKFRPYIDGVQKCYNSVLVGYSIKDDEF